MELAHVDSHIDGELKTNSSQYLTFMLDGEEYGVDILKVQGKAIVLVLAHSPFIPPQLISQILEAPALGLPQLSNHLSALNLQLNCPGRVSRLR